MTRILSISAAALVLALAAGVPVANASVTPAHIAAESGDLSAGVSQEEGSNVQAKIKVKVCFTTSCAFKPKAPRKECFKRVDNRRPRNRVDNRRPRNRVDNRRPRNRVDRRRCT